ncbi:MAG: FhaA domain-containing protein [Myxococcota bacterium]
MLKAETPDRFRADFSKVKRKGDWRKVFEPKSVVVVDAWAIGRAVSAAMVTCPFKSATGQPQVWNEYRVFLSRADHDRLRPIEQSLQKDLGPILYEELVRIDAVTVGALTVRLLVDDADEVEPGNGVLHARHVPDAQAAVPGAGEITVRLDKQKPMGPSLSAGGPGTVPVGAAVLRAPTGDVVLRSGVRHVLGRAHPDAGGDHVAIPGAGPRINRRQAAVRVDNDHVEVTREPADSNPVAVGGAALAPGQTVREKLPVEIVLSGEMKLVVQRVGGGAS